MGAAASNNTSDITDSVKNAVTNTTEISTSQVDRVKNVIDLSGCNINADTVKFKNLVTKNLTSVQIADVTNSNSLQNNIAQQCQQQAKSTVGSLGIGYAESSNSVSMSSNVSNAVTNALTSKDKQVSMTSNYFNCSGGSQITAKTVEIENSADEKLEQKNILTNSNVNDLKTTLTQTVKQTATSTVQGATAALLAIAAIIVAVGWSFGKVVTSGAAYVKPLISVVVLCIIAGVIYLAWMNNWAPFFNVVPNCLMRGANGVNDPYVGKASGKYAGKCNDCVDGVKNYVMHMPGCTPRYTYPLFSTTDTYGAALSIKPMSGNSASVLGMAQLSPCGAGDAGKYVYNNGGFNGATYWSLYQNGGAHFKFKTALNDALKNTDKKNNPLLHAMIGAIVADMNGGKTPFPEILTMPKTTTTPVKYYNIPDSYLVSGGNSSCTDCNYGICTPGYFIFDKSGKTVPNSEQSWPPSISASAHKPVDCLQAGGVYNIKDLKTTAVNMSGASTDDMTRALLIANDNSMQFKKYFWDPAGGSSSLVARLKADSDIPDSDKANIEDAVFGFVRFYLMNLILYTTGDSPINHGLNTYINDYELVNNVGSVTSGNILGLYAIEIPNTDMYFKYTPNIRMPLVDSFTGQPGILQGHIGLCNFKDLTLHKEIKKFGKYVLAVATVAILLMIWSASSKSSTVTRGGAALMESRGPAAK